MTTPSSITPQPAHVLLALMEHFRGRHLLQVEGNPSQALAAIGASFSVPLDAAPELPRLRAWLDDQAKRLPSLGAFYAKTEWGRDWANRQEAEYQRTLSAHERHARAENSQNGSWKNETDRLSLEAIDQSVLAAMASGGWLTVLPIHREKPNALAMPGPISFSTPGAPGVTYMVSNAQGDFRWDESGSDKPPEHRPMDASASGNQRSLGRWLVLLHEAAHCEFEELVDAFRPGDQRLSPQSVETFNRWVVDKVTNRRLDYRSTLNECFADVYSTMMLLEYAGHSPDAYAAVHRLVGIRTEDRKRSDQEMAAHDDVWLPGVIADVHSTDFALRRVLDAVDQWRGQPPEVLRELACRFASDGLVDFLDPQRVTPTGYPIGAVLCEGLGTSNNIRPPEEGYPFLFGDFMVSRLRGGKPETHIRERLAYHPARAFVEQAWAWMAPRLEEELLQQGQGFRNSVASFEFGATGFVHDRAKACFKRFLSFGLNTRALRDVVVQEKRAFSALSEDLRDWRARPNRLAEPDAPARRSPRLRG